MKSPKWQRLSGNKDITRAAGIVDDLRAFEEFREEILPMLRADIKAGTAPEEMRRKYQTYIEARKINIALTDPDSGTALAAARELTDRTEGKAVERKQVTHKYANLKDEELDAVLASEVETLSDILN